MMTDEHKNLVDEQPRSAAKELDHADVIKRWNRAWEKDRHNIESAYDDAQFREGINHWPETLLAQRLGSSQPCLTLNHTGKFVRHVTGDARKLSPDIRVIPNDDGAVEKIAEIRGGLIRHIERRRYAENFLYPAAIDSQVATGMGHIEIFGEYADQTTFRQEIGIRTPQDQISILWDPDSVFPTREDAGFCFCPVDLSREAYEEEYPDHPVSEMPATPSDGSAEGQTYWLAGDEIRIARYWYKVKIKRRLMEMPGGGYEDLDGAKPENIARMKAEGGKIVRRDAHQVRWVMMNGREFLTEPTDWPGRYIPLIPFIGEETRVGSTIYRHGVIYHMKDAQRAYNYLRSAQTEVLGLQPKSVPIGTDLNFKNDPRWENCNVKNYPYLTYTPDPRNGGVAPHREPPPQLSTALSEGVALALADMQSIVGIYDASLGARSNETSGIAIKKREEQGDTGTFVYLKNSGMSKAHVARVINDLIPYFYDTMQTIRIDGIDGTQRQEGINQTQPFEIGGVPTGMLNDMTVGSYDISFEMGPSYATKREQAADGMISFIQAFPSAGPVLAPVMADLQDWPRKDLVRDLLTTLAPPPVQAILAEKNNRPPPQPPPPDPRMIAEGQVMMAKAEAEKAKAQGEISRAEALTRQAQFEIAQQQLKLRQQELVNVKAEFEVLDAQMKLSANGPPLDSAKLDAWIEKVDEALRGIDRHAASQLRGLSGLDGPTEPAAGPPGPQGQNGTPAAPEVSPEPAQASPTPSPLPPGHYAALPEGTNQE